MEVTFPSVDSAADEDPDAAKTIRFGTSAGVAGRRATAGGRAENGPLG